MKTKLFIAASILAVLFTINSCKKDKTEDVVIKPNYSNLIVGTWVSDNVEGTDNLTDKKFVCQFNADKTEMYAEGCVVGDSTIWVEKTGFTYSLNEKILTIDGSAIYGNPSIYEIELNPLNENTMKFTDKRIVVNGVNYEHLYTYTMKKVQDNQNDRILGLWKGHETTPEATPEEFYWEYLDNGKYTYYYNDGTGHYLSDTTGYYYLYGNLLVFNFYKITEATYKYDCWETTITGDTLRFYSKREGGFEKTYEMIKTGVYPE